jgi:MFS family permease
VWPPARREWVAGLVVLVLLAAVGAALAPLWVHLAPRLAFRVDQPGRALPVVPEAEEYIAADGRFVLLTLAAGVLAGLLCWFLRSSRGPLLLVLLAAGGLLGAVVTWRLGLRLGTGYRPEDLQVVGRTVYQPLTLRAKAALVVEPVAAVVVYLLAAGFSSRNDLGNDPDGVSSDSG